MAFAPVERNSDATIYVGDLDGQVKDDLLWELFTQAGPVVSVHIPRDKVTAQPMGYGFVEFRTADDAEYAHKVMNNLFGRPMRVNRRQGEQRVLDVGANIFVGNLDPEVDERLLWETFSVFGNIIHAPKVVHEEETGITKGYAFVSFDSFESSDAAIEAMNGQYLHNRQIQVKYAQKKDDMGRKMTSRHGDAAERLLSQANPDRALPAQPVHMINAPTALPGMPLPPHLQPGMQPDYPPQPYPMQVPPTGAVPGAPWPGAAPPQ